MPVISNTTPASSNPDNQDSNHTLPGWLLVTMMPLLVVVVLFLICVPRLYQLMRYGRTSGTERSSSSPGFASTEPTSTEARDLLHLDVIAPPKTSEEMRRELTDGAHVCWAMLSSDTICAICLEDIQDTDMVRHLACEHTFHSNCIATWYLAKHDTCPICAFHFVSPKPVLQRPSQAHISDPRIDNSPILGHA
ncbi:uncharacterized protein B0J16DRAFT_351639 [Fusarium flagelliforme]|uniref:uncharacterized protein n=1 Tax=Fusarium flagelliforme TaxID=2675880 RepID=UPI001E8D90BF|nr:uncharacterized protein B0J16DRAFT_351639 [Fusarium flagelliforme]KAH7169836.1 hypothetical protein B0J16DRAFT_351639 [Fusarium flagelliforme]